MFQMQVKIADQWRSVRPSGGEPYEYATVEEAAAMIRMCYPDQLREDRLEAAAERVRIFDVATGETFAAWQFA